VTTVEQELIAWGGDHEYDSVAQLRGSASQRNIADPAAFERANYIEGLVDFANTFASAQGHGPW
jgi:dihydroorotate dehydrogenase (fumarate)